MNELISPKYQMKFISEVDKAIWDEYKSYKDVGYYIEKWREFDIGFDRWNFIKFLTGYGDIDLKSTLHSMPMDILMKIAIDLNVDTPDLIPSIQDFKDEIKNEYKTTYDNFREAYKQIETAPNIAIGLANSTLESIIKEILKDDRISNKIKGGETLYQLCSTILKEFNLTSNEHPKEIKTIANSLLTATQSIENLRSEKTYFHGKTDNDLLIEDPIYAYFIVNSITTIGLFLNKFYKTKYPKPLLNNDLDDLPF
jgi:hypothetical protein